MRKFSFCRRGECGAVYSMNNVYFFSILFFNKNVLLNKIINEYKITTQFGKYG